MNLALVSQYIVIEMALYAPSLQKKGRMAHLLSIVSLQSRQNQNKKGPLRSPISFDSQSIHPQIR
jgi:hypothetical protein